MSEDEKTALEVATEAAQSKADAENATRTGKGTRVKVSLTRGRNPQPISYEQWDDSKADTLPTTLSEFMDLRKSVADEAGITRRLILGDNEVLYSEAADPVAEFVESSWDADVQTRFKVTIRNFARDSGLSIEDAVAIIKPSVVASQKK